MSLSKSWEDKVPQIDIFANKIDDSDNTTQPYYVMSFFTHFDFESVSSSTHIADELTHIIVKA